MVPTNDFTNRSHEHIPHHRGGTRYSSPMNNFEMAYTAEDFENSYAFDADPMLGNHHVRRRSYTPPMADLSAPFRKMTVKMNADTIDRYDLRWNEMLILPPSITRMCIEIRCRHTQSSQTLRVAVPGDMRLREVLKQVLPKEYVRGAEALGKSRGVWQEMGSLMKVSDIVKESGRNLVDETEMRVIIGNDGMERGRLRGMQGWEREMGMVERMRVF